jgi:cell wall-associated NlpC family hydrolase
LQGSSSQNHNWLVFLPAKTSLLAAVKGYQNPKGYHQVHYTQVKPYGTVGYNLYRGYEGIKTWRVMHRLSTWAGHNLYNQATYNAVKNFQRRHNLPATGDVDLKTWQKLVFSKTSWYGIDNYIAPLRVQAWQGRSAHIEAMIHQAYQYMGKPWLAGCSSSPAYGVDCSGLVMQSLYAGGISPTPTSSIGHAHPGNEWNSRNLWADKHLKRVPYSERQRGDLVFYYQPGTHTIWHVAIYLGHNRVIESWPPRVMVQPIVNSQRNVIAGIKRPFI